MLVLVFFIELVLVERFAALFMGSFFAIYWGKAAWTIFYGIFAE